MCDRAKGWGLSDSAKGCGGNIVVELPVSVRGQSIQLGGRGRFGNAQQGGKGKGRVSVALMFPLGAELELRARGHL